MRPEDMIECKGPCLVHCYKCPPWTAFFAYGAMGYVIASVVYLAVTRFMGTPFDDSLSETQRKIKADSARDRMIVFGIGVAVAIVALLIWHPFSRSATITQKTQE